MSFSALLGVVSRASASSLSTFWPVAVATSVAPRALATLTWSNSSKGSSSSRQDSHGKLQQQQQQQQLMWCSLANNMRPSAAARGMEGAVAARRCCVAPRKSFSSATSVLSSKGDAGGEGVSFVETEDARRRNGDSGCVAFVTGANRGIGLEVTRQLLARTKGKVVAACRDPSSAVDLHALGGVAGSENRLDVVRMDIEDQASLESAAEHVKNKYGRVDLLFNVAGVLGDGKNTPGPERSLRAMDREWLRHTLEVNTIGPMMLVSALTPLLESPAKKGDAGAKPPSVVVNFSARVGSIGDNGMGGWHSYRMSKSALNMATKGISLELRRRRVWAFSYHPGTTDTGLSEPFQANVKPEKLFTPSYTVSQMLAIVDSMTEDLSGGFYAFDGSRIEW